MSSKTMDQSQNIETSFSEIKPLDFKTGIIVEYCGETQSLMDGLCAYHVEAALWMADAYSHFQFSLLHDTQSCVSII